MQVFAVRPPKNNPLPILISVPHCGTTFPDELKNQFQPELLSQPEDTDWFVHDLYDFAAEMGITLIHAVYSRYLIDLNRAPDNRQLYNDGRIQFGLVPAQTFSLKNLYRESALQPTVDEIERRKQIYYWPYYRKIEELLGDLQSQFRHVLFFDAHSIRHQIAAMKGQAFPDLILGDLDGQTADAQLIRAADQVLSKTGKYSYSHNHPFKGGHLTRYFGKPDTGIHALQLEMVQKIYMDEENVCFTERKAQEVRKVLKTLIAHLSQQLEGMNA